MKRLTLYIFALATLLSGLPQAARAVQDVKRASEVFLYTAAAEGDSIVVRWSIEEGYYLYRDKMKYSAADEGFVLGDPVYPAGEIHSDEFFGEQVVFRGDVRVRIPVIERPPGSKRLELSIRSQGCADFGLCYPPQTWSATVALPAAASPGSGAGLPGGLGRNADAPKPLGEVFRATASLDDPFTVVVRWDIEPGYYLYRDFFTAQATDTRVKVGNLQFPPGKKVMDLEYGETEVYYDTVEIRVPVSRPNPDPLFFELEMGYQGCKEDSICYPPDTVTLGIDLPPASADDFDAANAAPVSEQSRLIAVIADSGVLSIMAIFLGLGLLLSFTPCCLPMVPILSGIIAGQGDSVGTARAFWLSLSYVLGMAFTYTIAGAVFGAAGTQIQAALQTPLVIGAVATLFVVLALAMFGAYELQMPAALQTRLTAIGNNQKAGSFVGTAVMGAISALVVSTCVAPPLVAALTVIAQTGDVARGALALFSMGIGMGIPLLVIGTSAGKLLPKAGPWMNAIKAAFGFMMLALAVWMLSRLIPSNFTMGLYAALALAAAIRFGALSGLPKPASAGQIAGKTAALALLVYGGTLVVGLISGSTNPLQPLDRLSGEPSVVHMEFERIKSVEDFEAARRRAATEGRNLMLDFYADWCVSCKEMEYYTFTDPRVQTALENTVLIQADVTANDEVDQALLARFGIFGPPTIVFFDRQGNEIEDQRVVGYMPADDYLAHLDYVLSL